MALPASILAAVAVAWSGVRITRPHKTAIPSEYATMASLAQYIVARNPRLVTPRLKIWTRERAWYTLREVIIESTAIRDFDESSSFVEDMKLD